MQHFLLQCIAISKRLGLNKFVRCHSLLPVGLSVDLSSSIELSFVIALPLTVSGSKHTKHRTVKQKSNSFHNYGYDYLFASSQLLVFISRNKKLAIWWVYDNNGQSLKRDRCSHLIMDILDTLFHYFQTGRRILCEQLLLHRIPFKSLEIILMGTQEFG